MIYIFHSPFDLFQKDTFRRLSQRFFHRRMGTDDFEEIFYGQSAGYSQGHFGNQIIGAAAEELGSQQMVFLIGEDFHVSPFIGDETFGIAAHDHPACLEGKTFFLA